MLRAFKAKQLALRIGGLDHAIGEKHQPVAAIEQKCGLLVVRVGNHAQRKAGRQLEFAAIAIGAQVACIGDGQRAVGIDAGAEAGGKAGRGIELRHGSGRRDRAEQDMIQMIEYGAGVVRELVAQRADQGARVHGRLQALATHISNDNEQRVVLQRQDLEEVATDAVDWQIGALEHEVLVGRKLRGNEQRLYAACGCNLRGGALFDFTDANKPEENDRNQAG